MVVHQTKWTLSLANKSTGRKCCCVGWHSKVNFTNMFTQVNSLVRKAELSFYVCILSDELEIKHHGVHLIKELKNVCNNLLESTL